MAQHVAMGRDRAACPLAGRRGARQATGRARRMPWGRVMLVNDAIAAPGGWRDQAARRRAPLRDGRCDA